MQFLFSSYRDPRHVVLAFLLTASLFGLISCANLPPGSADSIRPGMHKDEVILRLGNPKTDKSSTPAKSSKTADGHSYLHYVMTGPTATWYKSDKFDCIIRLTNDVVESVQSIQNGAPLANDLPRINAIGLQPVLVFDSTNVPGTHTDLVIPVEGKNLEKAGTNAISVQVFGGSGPLSAKEFSWAFDRATGVNDLINLTVNHSYFDRTKSGDQLDVLVSIRREGDTAQPVCYSTRRFTLYDCDYYRQNVLSARVPTHDIQAFPLPAEEARHLFGPQVAQDYFVVRVSLRNTRKDDKLVSTGMVVANGRAIVFAGGSTFTIPINVSPQSTVHMYSILDAQEPFIPRSWFFRSLEFIGALASVTATAYGAPGGIVPPDFVTATTLFTGVGIPQAKKLWPEQWPDYKRNLVAYGMPELIKVPKNAVSNHRYLFFSKEKIQAVIADQTLFHYRNFRERFWNPGKSTFSEPDVRVISLAFDNLEVPFENVFSPAETDIKERTFQAQSRLSALSEQLKQLQALSRTAPLGETNLTGEVLAKLSNAASNVLATLKNPTVTNRPNPDYLGPALTNLTVLINAFSKDRYKGDLFDNIASGAFSFQSLQLKQDDLNTMQKKLLSYSDPVGLEPRLAQIEQAIQNASGAVQFYTEAAEALAKPEFMKALEGLASVAELNKTESYTSPNKLITTMLSLRDKRDGLPILSDFYPDARPETAKRLNNGVEAPAQ